MVLTTTLKDLWQRLQGPALTDTYSAKAELDTAFPNLNFAEEQHNRNSGRYGLVVFASNVIDWLFLYEFREDRKYNHKDLYRNDI